MARKNRKQIAVEEPVIESVSSEVFSTAIYARLSVENSGKSEKVDVIANQIEICKSYIAERPYYNVFHIDQTDGVQPKYKRQQFRPIEPQEEAERLAQGYISREKININYSLRDQAAYSPVPLSVGTASDCPRLFRKHYDRHRTDLGNRCRYVGVSCRKASGFMGGLLPSQRPKLQKGQVHSHFPCRCVLEAPVGTGR